jgi:IS5 family transposase
LFAAQNEIFGEQGWVMRGGSIIDATIIAAPSSTKNATGTRDPEMCQTKKGNQWYFGLKGHTGVDVGTGYVHTVTATAANVHDLDEAARLVRTDDKVAYADAGYQGAAKRPEIADDEHLSQIQWQVAARKGVLKTMTDQDRAIQAREASVRAKVEHPYLVIKRGLRIHQDPLPRDREEPQPPPRAVRLSELADASTRRRPHTGDGIAPACPKPPQRARNRAPKQARGTRTEPLLLCPRASL